MTNVAKLNALARRVAQEFNGFRLIVGALQDLQTANKSSIVSAINELANRDQSGTTYIDDDGVSTTTTWSSDRLTAEFASIELELQALDVDGVRQIVASLETSNNAVLARVSESEEAVETAIAEITALKLVVDDELEDFATDLAGTVSSINAVQTNVTALGTDVLALNDSLAETDAAVEDLGEQVDKVDTALNDTEDGVIPRLTALEEAASKPANKLTTVDVDDIDESGIIEFGIDGVEEHGATTLVELRLIEIHAGADEATMVLPLSDDTNVVFALRGDDTRRRCYLGMQTVGEATIDFFPTPLMPDLNKATAFIEVSTEPEKQTQVRLSVVNPITNTQVYTTGFLALPSESVPAGDVSIDDNLLLHLTDAVSIKTQFDGEKASLATAATSPLDRFQRVASGVSLLGTIQIVDDALAYVQAETADPEDVKYDATEMFTGDGFASSYTRSPSSEDTVDFKYTISVSNGAADTPEQANFEFFSNGQFKLPAATVPIGATGDYLDNLFTKLNDTTDWYVPDAWDAALKVDSEIVMDDDLWQELLLTDPTTLNPEATAAHIRSLTMAVMYMASQLRQKAIL